MAEKMFPTRRRCKTCGKALGVAGAPVIAGQYDTYRCAGMAEPVSDPGRAPRECVTSRDGSWAWKRRYRSAGEVPDKIVSDASTNIYQCGHCGHLHVGHTRMGEQESFIGLRSREQIANWLIKLRGGAKHTEVAAVARRRGASRRVLAVRIKEWEDPGFDNPSVETLLAILPLYQAGLAGLMSRKSSRRDEATRGHDK